MSNTKRTIRIEVVVTEGERKLRAGLETLPAIVDVKHAGSDVDVPLGIPAAVIANDIKKWLDPLLKGWLWDYVRARALREAPPKPTYTPKYNNPEGAVAE